MSKKSWDTDWLIFSKRARIGALVFLFAFILIAVAPRLYRNYFSSEHVEINVSHFKEPLEDKKTSSPEENKRFSKPTEKFDPNDYQVEDWMKIGLSQKQSESIINYIGKGGTIKYKEDLLKLYVVDEELYAVLSPMILLPSREDSATSLEQEYKEEQKNEGAQEKEDFKGTIDINLATKDELMQVNGIGKYYAEQIINKRKRFGGLSTLDQLSDLYMMTTGKLDSLSAYLKIDPKNIVKLDVNLATKGQLSAHPWINVDMANSIVFIRERYGNYDSLDGLLQSPYIDAKILEKLKPYLKVK